MSGSTSKTEQEPLGRPEVPLQLLFPIAATSVKWQEQQNFTKKLNPGVILFLLFFFPFLFSKHLLLKGLLCSTISSVQNAGGENLNSPA